MSVSGTEEKLWFVMQSNWHEMRISTVFALVICQLDIGCSIFLLTHFSTFLHEEHFDALKGTCKHPQRAKSWCIMFCHPLPLNALPDTPFPFLEEDPNLPPFPLIFQDELIGCLNAAHATDLKTCHSKAGLVVLFCFATITWESHIWAVVATSLTEAEFYLSVTSGKIAKYLHCILAALDALQPDPMCLFIDNMTAFHVINEKHPTPCAWYIGIQHFAIQERCKKQDLVMEHLSGILNPSDDLTKPLWWVLHARHAHCSLAPHMRLLCSPICPLETHKAGEGDGAWFKSNCQSWGIQD